MGLRSAYARTSGDVIKRRKLYAEALRLLGNLRLSHALCKLYVFHYLIICLFLPETLTAPYKLSFQKLRQADGTAKCAYIAQGCINGRPSIHPPPPCAGLFVPPPPLHSMIEAIHQGENAALRSASCGGVIPEFCAGRLSEKWQHVAQCLSSRATAGVKVQCSEQTK